LTAPPSIILLLPSLYPPFFPPPLEGEASPFPFLPLLWRGRIKEGEASSPSSGGGGLRRGRIKEGEKIKKGIKCKQRSEFLQYYSKDFLF